MQVPACLIKGQKESVSQCQGGTKGASEKKNEQRQKKNPKTAQDFVLSTCFYFPPTVFLNPLLFLPLRRVHCFLQGSLLQMCVQINEGFHLETNK